MYHWFTNTIEQHFEPIALLKESSRGSVHLIRHRATGKKYILRKFSGNGEVYQKLLSCSCKHLPTILEAVHLEGQNLILEEYISGDTLDFLLKNDRFTEKQTKEIVLQICQALYCLHSIGAIHRDIKPENIILRGSDAVLIDFDASRLYKADATNDTQVLGTLGFAPPEQYGFSQSDPRTDIYSLGVLINIMLTGAHPSQKLAQGAFEHIIQKCTQLSPKKRYHDILHLMKEI